MSYPFSQPEPQQYYDRDGLPISAPQPVPQPQYAMVPVYPAQQKSWIVTFLLALHGGLFGAHNFYLGYTSRAVVQLSLTILGVLTSILLIGFFFLAIVSVWAIVDVIMILTRSGSMGHDSRGIPLN